MTVARAGALPEPALAELCELLRIPSIGEDRAAVRRAVDWVCALVERSGGAVERRSFDGVPLGVATIHASPGHPDAATVLVYGHVDVQPPGDLGRWESPPFAPVVRDGWLVARGAADDKGPFWALLRAAADLAAEGRLPVHVRVLCDTEEETGGRTAVRFLADDPTTVAACVIFDTGMPAPGEPVAIVATRGIVSYRVRVRTGTRDLHSGLFGGVAHNAAHALMTVLSAVVRPDGSVPPELAAGVAGVDPAEAEAWRALPPGDEVLADQGAVAVAADGEFYARLWAAPAVDVHGLRAGITETELNIVPCEAEAWVSLRLAPGQDVARMGECLATLLRDAAPSGVDLELERGSATPPAGPMDPTAPAFTLGVEALRVAFGRAPRLTRTGGSLPILAALSARGIPTLLSGIDLPGGNIHAPDERVRLDQLAVGVEAGRALLLAWGALGRT